jgi:adenylate cyclase
MPQALDAARRSLELDPDLAEGHNALACATMLYDLDFNVAEREFLRALELYPDYPQAMAWYGLFLLQWVSARQEEARDELLRALQVDPLSGYAHVIMSFSCVSSGRFAEAVEHAKRGVELDPSSYLAFWCYSAALEYLKHYEKAVMVAEQALAMSGRHSWAMMTLASTYAAQGKHSEGQAVFRELEARGRREYIPPAMLAATAAVVGEIDRAIEFAQQALDCRDPLFVMLARTWPDYDNIRSDPRFLEIVGKLGLPGWPSAHDRQIDETHSVRT